MAKRWSDLTPTQQRALAAGVAFETALKVAMLADLWHRPAEQVRGPKWAWGLGALVNTAGVLPIVYFVRGRRSASD